MRPPRDQLLALRDQLTRSVEDAAATVEIIASFDLPDFVRETEFVSLKGDGEDGYPFIGRQMISTDGVDKGRDNYLDMTNDVQHVVAQGEVQPIPRADLDQ